MPDVGPSHASQGFCEPHRNPTSPRHGRPFHSRNPDEAERLVLSADAAPLRRQRPQRKGPPQLRPHHGRPALTAPASQPRGDPAETSLTDRPTAAVQGTAVNTAPMHGDHFVVPGRQRLSAVQPSFKSSLGILLTHIPMGGPRVFAYLFADLLRSHDVFAGGGLTAAERAAGMVRLAAAVLIDTAIARRRHHAKPPSAALHKSSPNGGCRAGQRLSGRARKFVGARVQAVGVVEVGRRAVARLVLESGVGDR